MAQTDAAILQLERTLSGVQIESMDPNELCTIYHSSKKYIDGAIVLLDTLGMKAIAAALRLLEKIADSACPV